MRDLNDNIVYALNASLPTESFKGQVNPEAKCRDLHKQLQSGYGDRQDAIKKCILVSADTVKQMKDKRDESRDDVALNKQFKSEQRKVGALCNYGETLNHIGFVSYCSCDYCKPNSALRISFESEPKRRSGNGADYL